LKKVAVFDPTTIVDVKSLNETATVVVVEEKMNKKTEKKTQNQQIPLNSQQYK